MLQCLKARDNEINQFIGMFYKIRKYYEISTIPMELTVVM